MHNTSKELNQDFDYQPDKIVIQTFLIMCRKN